MKVKHSMKGVPNDITSTVEPNMVGLWHVIGETPHRRQTIKCIKSITAQTIMTNTVVSIVAKKVIQVIYVAMVDQFIA